MAENAKKSDPRKVPSKKRRNAPSSPLRLQPSGRKPAWNILFLPSCLTWPSCVEFADLTTDSELSPRASIAQWPGTGMSECDELFEVSAMLLVSSSVSSLLENFRGTLRRLASTTTSNVLRVLFLSCMHCLACMTSRRARGGTCLAFMTRRMACGGTCIMHDKRGVHDRSTGTAHLFTRAPLGAGQARSACA